MAKLKLSSDHLPKFSQQEIPKYYYRCIFQLRQTFRLQILQLDQEQNRERRIREFETTFGRTFEVSFSSTCGMSDITDSVFVRTLFAGLLVVRHTCSRGLAN